MRTMKTASILVAMLVLGCGTQSEDDPEVARAALTLPTHYYTNSETYTLWAGPPGGPMSASWTMLACAPGYAVTGFYKGSSNCPGGGCDWLKCNQFNGKPGAQRYPEVYNPRTIWQAPPATGHTSMQTCGWGNTAMVGFHASTNRLGCQDAISNHTEVLDLGTQDWENPPGVPRMHVCPAGYAMSGIHLGKNQLACIY